MIHGKHMYDAINALGAVDKKGAAIAKSVLEAARKNGTNAGLAEDRLFVKYAIVGKALSHKKLDIKARGKMGIIRVPKTSVSITVEERSPLDFYKMVMKGETPAAVGQVFRKILY